MNKILQKFFVIIIAFIFINMYIGIDNKVFGASVSVSSSSIDVGGTTTISVSIPSGYVAYEGTVSFDSSKLSYVSSSSGNLSGGSVKVADANTNLEQVSNFSVTFQGNAEGTANVSVNLILVDANSNSDSASGSGSVTIKSQEAPPVETPDANNPEPNSSSSNNPAPPVQKEPNFSQVNETVYATKSMNVRASWSTSSSKIGGLSAGQAVTRTGIGDNGWSRISYNGKTAYVSTSLITTTKPEEPEEPEELDENSEEQNPEENSESPEENNENSEENEIYQKIVDEIGTIPEVGNNINKYIFGVLILLSIISIMIIFRKEV